MNCPDCFCQFSAFVGMGESSVRPEAAGSQSFLILVFIFQISFTSGTSKKKP